MTVRAECMWGGGSIISFLPSTSARNTVAGIYDNAVTVTRQTYSIRVYYSVEKRKAIPWNAVSSSELK